MKNLNEYINESLNPKTAQKAISQSYQEDGDATSIGSCWQWLDEIDWKKAEKMDDKKLTDAIVNINDDIDSDMALERYIPVIRALLTLGRDAAYEYLESFIDEEELEDCGIDD
jgi:hypothetical protein